MSDPVMQLTEQHNQLRRLFKQIPALGGHQSAGDRAQAICELLAIHSALEEELIYPVIREIDPAMAAEALQAHKEAGILVGQIVGSDYPDNGPVKEDLLRLADDVEAHASWEEANLLPRISALPGAHLDQLGRALYERRQELLRQRPDALEISAETEGFLAAPRI